MIYGCPGSQKFRQPQPENVMCPFCEKEIEIWTDEFRAVCPGCAKVVSRAGQCCLDWCKAAKECVGEQVYKDYEKNKKEKEV